MQRTKAVGMRLKQFFFLFSLEVPHPETLKVSGRQKMLLWAANASGVYQSNREHHDSIDTHKIGLMQGAPAGKFRDTHSPLVPR